MSGFIRQLHVYTAFRIRFISAPIPQLYGMGASAFFSQSHNEVLRLIARRGGFLARKSENEPGVGTIRKGLTHVRIAAETLRLLRDKGSNGIYV